jgi:hypothetical protein
MDKPANCADCKYCYYLEKVITDQRDKIIEQQKMLKELYDFLKENKLTDEFLKMFIYWALNPALLSICLL